MIQFNLLPDVKLEYIKARRAKRLVLLASAIASAVTVSIAIILFIGVNKIQKDHLRNLSEDIAAKSEELKKEKDIDKILTVQNQLNNLNDLHDSKPAADRLGGYLGSVTPNEVFISELTVDFSANTMTFKGESSAIKFVNEFIDTMKFTNYELTEKDAEGKNIVTTSSAFSNIVLASFDRDDEDAGAPVEYEVTLSFDPAIFDITKKVKLVVPSNKITTRSITERPTPLFKEPTSKEEQ